MTYNSKKYDQKKLNWKQFCLKITFWITTEIVLGLVGIDDLADYHEFLAENDNELAKKNSKIVKISQKKPMFCQKIQEICPIKDIVFSQGSSYESYLHSTDIFVNKCMNRKIFCLKVEILSKLI